MAADGIVDLDAADFQADKGKCHCDAVIAECLDLARTDGRRFDENVIAVCESPNAESVQIDENGVDTVAFLCSDVRNVPQNGGRFGKRRQDGKGERLVGEVLDVLIKPVVEGDKTPVGDDPVVCFGDSDALSA